MKLKCHQQWDMVLCIC
uniref:Uncharacterized protein n=1 Tax=Arundo donax TaxID=35708 RepID=A0A0A9E942_ARUDO